MWNIGGISKYYYKIARYKFKISSCLTLMIQTIILDIYRYKWEGGNGVNAKIPTKHKNSKGVKRSPFENLTKKLEPTSTAHWSIFFSVFSLFIKTLSTIQKYNFTNCFEFSICWHQFWVWIQCYLVSILIFAMTLFPAFKWRRLVIDFQTRVFHEWGTFALHHSPQCCDML